MINGESGDDVWTGVSSQQPQFQMFLLLAIICRTKPPLLVTCLESLARQSITRSNACADATSINIFSYLPSLLPLRRSLQFYTTEALVARQNISKSIRYGHHGAGRCGKQVLICTSPVLHRANRGSSWRQRVGGVCSNSCNASQRLMRIQLFSWPSC